MATRILVVEDEPAIALGLRNDLILDGYAVETATDGEQASARALDGRFDLILLDVMLPKRDGFAVCRDLRRAGVRTPIILLTARAQDTDKVLGLELGADDYVTKPFSPMEVCARIKAVLRRTGAGGGLHNEGVVERRCNLVAIALIGKCGFHGRALSAIRSAISLRDLRRARRS